MFTIEINSVERNLKGLKERRENGAAHNDNNTRHWEISTQNYIISSTSEKRWEEEKAALLRISVKNQVPFNLILWNLIFHSL